MTLEEKRPVGRPKNSYVQDQLDLASDKAKVFEESVKEMTLDRMNQAPIEEKPPQIEVSQADRSKQKEIYLKPVRTIGTTQKFNEKFRKEYEYDKTFVRFEAENHEIFGEDLDLWTKPYQGVPAEEWKVPTNKAVWGPRYLAEQIKRKRYHRLVMKENVTVGGDHAGTYYGSMAADTTIQRLDARPVAEKTSVFMGARNF
jgi:hypothetical protein